MYEVGMSANGRIEPGFEPIAPAWEGEAPVSLGPEHLVYEEDTSNSFGGLLVKSGLVILLAMTAYGGYQIFGNNSAPHQVAKAKPGYDWSGKPISAEERQKLTGIQADKQKIRQIDLTKTASVKKNTTPIARPVPVEPKISAGSQFHVVQPGDTLSAIGRKFKISAKDIMEINSIEDARRIKPGLKLIISQ